MLSEIRDGQLKLLERVETMDLASSQPAFTIRWIDIINWEKQMDGKWVIYTEMPDRRLTPISDPQPLVSNNLFKFTEYAGFRVKITTQLQDQGETTNPPQRPQENRDLKQQDLNNHGTGELLDDDTHGKPEIGAADAESEVQVLSADAKEVSEMSAADKK